MATLPTADPGPAFTAFVAERHLAVLTLVRSNGRPHSTPVGFTWDADHARARIITWSGSVKVSLLAAGSLEGSICQVDGGRWLTIEGPCTVTSDPAACADAVQHYATRYRPPKERGTERRVILLEATRILAGGSLA
jgi:hypothetical protein|tara:strand:+ start:428 stop:835 length:408 start_codon:yes stop_codon:yes gene_type:complete